MTDRTAIDRLRVQLEIALKKFKEIDGREGEAHAILAVCQFLIDQKVERRLIAPLHSVAGKIAEADKTTATKPMMVAVQMTTAAWAIDVLKGAGLKLSDAAKRVATATEFDDKALLEFRKNLGKGRVRPEAVEEYRKVHQRYGLLDALARDHRIAVTLEVCSSVIQRPKTG